MWAYVAQGRLGVGGATNQAISKECQYTYAFVNSDANGGFLEVIDEEGVILSLRLHSGCKNSWTWSAHRAHGPLPTGGRIRDKSPL